MTILKCSAANCVYNDAHQCSRGEINVMGESARIADETCCGSFQEKSDAATNGMECHRGCEKIQIECKAHNCAYNDNCKCKKATAQQRVISCCVAALIFHKKLINGS